MNSATIATFIDAIIPIVLGSLMVVISYKNKDEKKREKGKRLGYIIIMIGVVLFFLKVTQLNS